MSIRQMQKRLDMAKRLMALYNAVEEVPCGNPVSLYRHVSDMIDRIEDGDNVNREFNALCTLMRQFAAVSRDEMLIRLHMIEVCTGKAGFIKYRNNMSPTEWRLESQGWIIEKVGGGVWSITRNGRAAIGTFRRRRRQAASS